MKDLFEYKLTSLIFGLLNGCDITFAGYVIPNSPAEKSGIKIDDILIKVGDKDIETASDVIEQISKNGIKKQVNILNNLVGEKRQD